jgi:hypothetical protein
MIKSRSPQQVQKIQKQCRHWELKGDAAFFRPLTICLKEIRSPKIAGHASQGVLRLNGRELLFGEAERVNRISFLTARATAIVFPISVRVNVKRFPSGPPLRCEIPNEHRRNYAIAG